MKRESRAITSRAEWLQWRREHVTASRIAALFDAHPYMSRDDLAASLDGASQGDNPAMRAGRILEPGVLSILAEDHPDWRIVPNSAPFPATYHWLPKHRLGATPDAWLNDDGLIQVKTVSPEVWEEWHGTVPLAYTLQTLTELLVTGRTRGVLAVMVRSRSYPLHEFEVPRHEAAEERILAAVADWWKAWDAGERPAPASAAQGLEAMLDDGTHRDLSGDNLIRELLEEREALKASEGATAKRLKEIDYDIKNRLGNARTAWLPGWLLKFPTIHAKAYTVEARDYRRLTVSRTED